MGEKLLLQYHAEAESHAEASSEEGGDQLAHFAELKETLTKEHGNGRRGFPLPIMTLCGPTSIDCETNGRLIPGVKPDGAKAGTGLQLTGEFLLYPLVEDGRAEAPDLAECWGATQKAHEEAFGTAGRGSPANRFRTRSARKAANGPMSSPTLAISRASI
jgi:hypothetical protein